MASMSLMLAKSNFVVQPGRERRSFVTEIRSSNPVEEWRLLLMPAGRGGRREGVVVRAGLGAFSSAVQRRRSRKGGRRRKKRQGSQTQDVDPHSISNEDGLGKLPDNNNGTSLRDAHDDDAEHIFNSDNETEESRLDHIHSDGTELSQHNQGKESEGSILQELEEKVTPGQQSPGSNLNSIRLDAIQRESHSQFVENLTVSATMQQFLGTTNLSQLQQTTVSSGMVQEQSSGLILAETSEILDPHVFIHSVNAASWYSSIQQVENHPQSVTGQLVADQSPSSNGSTGYKSDSEEVGDQVTLGAGSSKKVPMRKTKGDDVKMDQLMVRKTSGEAERPADVEVLLDISVVDAKVSEPEVFENGGHCMEASTAGVNHSNGHTKPNSSLGKVDKKTLNVSQVTESVTLPVAEVTDSVTSTVSNVQDTVKSTVADATDSVTSTAAEFAESETSATGQVLESVSPAADQVSSTASWQTYDYFTNSAGNLPSFLTSDAPEFRGLQGIQNVHILQEDLGLLATIYDFYIFMLKRPLPQFALGMFAAPILLSVLFTGLYLLDFQGLSLDETARGDDTSGVLTNPWTLFRLFMFSLSLSTGLEPELVPVSPYTLVVANINALFAQLLFVFLSGAVFARLSQPSHPVRSSKVALMCPAFTQPKESGDASAKIVLMARFVLVGPQPCELVDVKVDLTYKYNTVTRIGSFFRARRSLKLVRSEVAHLTYGMLVRHIIDETSPLYNRTLEMLHREDAVFTLSVIGLERTSMQCVFHLQHYCVSDADVIWDAEFEDMVLINPKKERIYDHSKLSWWRAV
ncbi:unnamed protein product [Sphagnum troendelagicum]